GRGGVQRQGQIGGVVQVAVVVHVAAAQLDGAGGGAAGGRAQARQLVGKGGAQLGLVGGQTLGGGQAGLVAAAVHQGQLGLAPGQHLAAGALQQHFTGGLPGVVAQPGAGGKGLVVGGGALDRDPPVGDEPGHAVAQAVVHGGIAHRLGVADGGVLK